MEDGELGLMAHLMRRAGFGATREELHRYLKKGYEETVEELLYPGDDDLDEDIVRRYYIDIDDLRQPDSIIGWWIYRNINSGSPLREKMALFYHGLFATRWDKVINTRDAAAQIDMFRRRCLDNFRTVLMELSRDPAMLIFLDNDVNHNATPNENYGRELLELFSMGVDTFTEDDVKACARAFTGWNVSHKIPKVPWGDFPREFEYRPSDHDHGERVFLGERGHFNGDDIVDIIVEHPATGRFVASKLYNFFVSDGPPPEDELQILSDAYVDSHQDIRSMMRVLLNSEFFKAARFAKVKSPVDMVSGVLRLVGDFREPQPGLVEVARHAKFMGQELLSPPTVEGWHTGKEWIDTASLVARVNFATEQIGDIEQPGVQAIIQQLGSQRSSMTPEELVDGCLDLIGPVEAQPETRHVLLEQAYRGGVARFDTADDRSRFAHRVGDMLRFVVATAEFQFM